MSNRSILREARGAILGLWLAGAGVATADPMLVNAPEALLAVPPTEDVFPESSPRSAGHAPLTASPSYPAPGPIQSGVAETPSIQHDSIQSSEYRRAVVFQPPSVEGSAPGEDDVLLRRLLQHYAISSGPEPAPRRNGERARQGTSPDSVDLVDPVFATPEASVRAAAANVLQMMSNSGVYDEEVVALFVSRFGEFQSMFRTELRSLTDSVAEFWPLYDDAWSESTMTRTASAPQQQNPFAGSMMATFGQSALARPEEPVADILDFLVSMLRGFITNPIAVIATCSTLVMWKSFEWLFARRARRPRRIRQKRYRVRRSRADKSLGQASGP